MLLDALSIHKRLSVTEAAELLGVPAATVRRDFEELARQQLATRTHGGVVATTVAYDLPARYRIAPGDPRERIAHAAAELVRHGEVRDGFPGAARHRGGRFTEDRDAALARICTIDQVDGLVTDDVADPDQVRRLRDAGVDVTLV